MTPPPNKGLDNPFETPLPDGDMYPDDEVSEVKDVKSSWKKLAKIERTLNRMVDPISQIPDIREKVEGVVERVAKVEERLTTTKEKVADLDQQSRRPHDCFQVDNIEKVEVATLSLRKDVEEDTRKIELMSKDVALLSEGKKSAKELRRSAHYFWVAIAIGFLTTAGGAIWYMRGVSAEIQLEAQAREAQFTQVETVLTKVSKQTDNTPVVQQLEQLQTSVDRNGHAKMEEWCSRLTDEDVKQIKTTLPRRSWPECGRLTKVP